MRRVLSFLVWLFSLWTWKVFFLRWLRSPASHPSGGEAAEHVPSREGPPKSELARFLSSLPENKRRCESLSFDGDSEVRIRFGQGSEFKLFHGTGVGASYREFLEAVASSEIVFREGVVIILQGDDSCQHVEAFADAHRQFGNGFRKLDLHYDGGSAIRFAKCVRSLLLGNDAIEDIALYFQHLQEEMAKDKDAKFFVIVVGSHNFQTLKSFSMWVPEWVQEGMEQLLEPFKGPLSKLENLILRGLTSDIQVEHIDGMLASNTSLKILSINPFRDGFNKKAFTKGYTNIGVALCSNQSLEALHCGISSSLELKALLDPLMPKTNNPQRNTTLTKLNLRGSIGGKEGIQTLVDMICTNSSLLKLHLVDVKDLSSRNVEGIDNVLAILEALKTNKCLKKISLKACKAVGGYKVLGAMMDLFLENHCIEDICLYYTSLKDARDMIYVYSALAKRKKVKLWDIVQGMANVKPTFARVFLCGNPYAGKTSLRMSMKKLKEFQQKDEIPNQSQIRQKIRNAFKTSHASKVPTEDKPLERTHGIEVESVQCDGIGITIWDMAGQTNYHSFHELVMPNLSTNGSSSIFFLVCNPIERLNPSERRRLSDIKDELETWLRFIASNTRRSLLYRPHVSIVMTHFDHWMDDRYHLFAKCIDEEVV